MKKLFTLLFALLLLGGNVVMAQGLETFANFPVTGSTYTDGTFTGQDGSTWTFNQCRGDIAIEAPTPMLGRNRPTLPFMESGTIANGIATLSFTYMQGFSANCNMDVMVNGNIIATITTNAQQNVVQTFGPVDVNVSGNFVLKFIQKEANAGQIAIDNITWTSMSGGFLPEPSNYPTNFTATGGIFSATLNWADAVGAQLPQKYLIVAGESSTLGVPVDGTPIEDDIDLSDGKGAKNVSYGTTTFTFNKLEGGKTYYFKIYSYTNSGSYIDYKTDGTVPSANATTEDLVTIFNEDFNDGDMNGWVGYSVSGDQVWGIDATHGVDLTPCAKMSGYATAAVVNEDWLISPLVYLNNYHNEKLVFYTASNYTGPALEVLVSSNYSGQGNPNISTWTPLTANFSAGSWTWTPSGYVDFTGYGDAIRVAFKYTSTSTEAATWEVDNIMIIGALGTGVSEVNSQAMVTVRPNPVVDDINVYFNGNGTAQAILYDLTGAAVAQSQLVNGKNTMNANSLSAGMYLLKVVSSEMKQVYTQKIIVK